MSFLIVEYQLNNLSESKEWVLYTCFVPRGWAIVA